MNLNSVYFLYSGKSDLDEELTFEQTANNIDKERNKMNILVSEKDNSFNQNNNNNIPMSTGKPLIFETLAQLDKKYD